MAKIFLLLLLVFFGLRETGEAADKIKIGVSNYNLSNLSVGVAHKRGLFKEEGIEAEIIAMRPSIVTAALVSGDLAYSTLIGSVVGAAVKGSPVRLIAVSLDRPPLALVAQKKIGSVNQLKGATVGVGSYGSTPDLVARRIVKHFGFDPERDIRVLAFGSAAARLSALQKGIVDIIVVAPPEDFEAQKLGFNVLVRADELLTFPYNGMGTSLSRIEQHADEVKRLIKVLIKANRFIRKNREGTIQVLVDWAKTERAHAAAAYDVAYRAFSEDGSAREDDIRLMIENAKKSLNVTRSILPSDVADLSSLRQAQRELGLKVR
ncbi:MAG: ABC transporter substrate-binding protein [Deltaproteobacteria bacterium]|nr:ABC transporter substrate-binding protein [Deltaproteobacteria bacterium]